jgi:hypothetical protein
MAGRKRTRIERDCEVCGRLIDRPVIPSRIRVGRGRFCSTDCYRRGTVLSLADRFRRHIGPALKNGCIEWGGVKNTYGYGTLRKGPKGAGWLLAHRVSYELAYGPIPDGLGVLHRCDNPPCVNVEHLFLGTQADNVADMVAKGRIQRGTQRRDAKLTEDIVREIRQRYAAGGVTQKSLAGEFGVLQAKISKIVLRRCWPHV